LSKDTGRLIESKILPTLTSGLNVVATPPLHIYKDDEGNIICKFGETCPTTQHIATTIPHVDLYITGNLAFQAMALGKESMSGHWCIQCMKQMQCTLTIAQLSEVKMWTVEEYCRLGEEAERRGTSKTKLGVKQKPWWDFIPITHYMVPLLHCMIGVGNQLLDVLRDIINEHLENMTRTEERIRASIPLLENIIAKTAVNRDSWDASDDGKLLKKLKRNVASRSPLLSVSEASTTNDSATIAIAITVDVDIAPATTAYADAKADADATNTETDEINLRTLDEFQ
jgi:hypothetical protein